MSNTKRTATQTDTIPPSTTRPSSSPSAPPSHEDIEAMQQWIATGTVPLEYYRKRIGTETRPFACHR